MPTPTHTKLGSGLLYEQPESGAYEFADKITQTRIFKGLYTDCLAAAHNKGDAGTAPEQIGWIVQRCTVTRLRGEQGLLTVVWEAGGGDDPGRPLPPDSFSITPFEISPPLAKNKYFKDDVSSSQLTLVEKALNDSQREREAAIDRLIELGNTPTNNIRPYHLYIARAKGVDTFYLAGFRYTWSFSSWSYPDLNIGGYLETPGGPLAGYLPPGLSWLREADTLTEGSIPFRVTRSWLGGPDGHWEADYYAP